MSANFQTTAKLLLSINNQVESLAPGGGDGIIQSMKRISLILLFFSFVLPVASVFSQNRATGGIKGKVKVETGTPSGVSVIVRQGEREVIRGVTDKNGQFLILRLAPGRYGVTLRKPGLSVGSIEDIEVKAGETRSLGDRLVLSIDEGSIAFIRGSVFNQDDRSAPNIRIELAKIEDDGTARKIDGRITNEIGAFVFRLAPDAARYRITAKPNGGDPVSKDVEIDGAAVYRVALSIKRTRN
jgi:Carboxypeptidase regulatory-like domain